MKTDLKEYLIDGYLPSIGIECHVQLKTKTKLFTAIENAPDLKSKPNHLVGPLCLGLPGALPVINQKAVDLGILAGLSLSAKINSKTSFDRKHYFYPDLPLGYQISQHYQPLVLDGLLKIPLAKNKYFTVRIQRAHLEADAGKLIHDDKTNQTLVDLNRVGTPLLEIVSLPDMHTAWQAKLYAKELYLRMIYADVCWGNLAAGNLRFDVNVSVSSDLKTLGTRTEIKNLNSFRFIEQALDYEIKRQIDLLKNGQTILQETRGFNESKKQTFSQRSKEDAQDYRYMPDPDLPPLTISQSKIDSLKNQLLTTPTQMRSLFNDWDIPFAQGEILLDYPLICKKLNQIKVDLSSDLAKLLINWLTGEVLAMVKIKTIDWSVVLNNFDNFKILGQLVVDKKINLNIAKNWLPKVLKEDIDPLKLLSDNQDLLLNDEAELKELVLTVFKQNPKAVADAHLDNKGIGFLIGQVMRRSQNQADPKLAKELILKELKNQAD